MDTLEWHPYEKDDGMLMIDLNCRLAFCSHVRSYLLFSNVALHIATVLKHLSPTLLGLRQLYTFGASEVRIGNAACFGIMLICLVDWGNCKRLM